MKAIQVFGPQDLRLVEVPDPVAGEGQVLVRVRASGICGSDKWMWRAQGPLTRIQGHEAAGEVAALGPGVKRLQVGNRVAVNNVVGCGSCPACRAGAFVRCPNWNGEEDVNGGYGELVAAPERNCLLLKDEIDFETGCLIFDNFGTPFGALERASVGVGDDVLVIGCGPIGLGAVALARLRGAFVIALDPLENRREMALQLGAELAFAPGESVVEQVRRATSSLGVGVVIECSGKGPAYQTGLESLRVGGTFVALGEGAQFDLHPSQQIIRRALNLIGSWYSSMPQGAQVQDLICAGKIAPRRLVTQRGTLAQMEAIFQQVVEQPDQVIKAVILG